MIQNNYQSCIVHFHHLQVEARLYDQCHYIYDKEGAKKPVSLLWIKTLFPAGHPLPGADYDPNHIGVGRASSHTYPLRENILNHGGLENHVTAFLASMTDNAQWKKLVEQSQQLTLF